MHSVNAERVANTGGARHTCAPRTPAAGDGKGGAYGYEPRCDCYWGIRRLVPCA